MWLATKCFLFTRGVKLSTHHLKWIWIASGDLMLFASLIEWRIPEMKEIGTGNSFPSHFTHWSLNAIGICIR